VHHPLGDAGWELRSLLDRGAKLDGQRRLGLLGEPPHEPIGSGDAGAAKQRPVPVAHGANREPPGRGLAGHERRRGAAGVAVVVAVEMGGGTNE
jgi:hypothetical protein